MYLLVTVLCICLYLYEFIHTGEDTAELADLYRYVSHFVKNWDTLGAQLGLKQHQLDVISENNAYNPKRAESCCKAMLSKWLKIDTSPTWGKLEDAVNAIRGSSVRDSDIAGAYYEHL